MFGNIEQNGVKYQKRITRSIGINRDGSAIISFCRYSRAHAEYTKCYEQCFGFIRNGSCTNFNVGAFNRSWITHNCKWWHSNVRYRCVTSDGCTFGGICWYSRAYGKYSKCDNKYQLVDWFDDRVDRYGNEDIIASTIAHVRGNCYSGSGITCG